MAFAGKKRIIGVAAKNQQVTNMKNTISNFKSLVGRKYKDPQVQKELQYIPYRCEERPDGSIGVRVNYLDEEQVFSPEQLTAMVFTKLKETSEAALSAQINDCVLAVPISATNAERVALLDSASIAGFNVLRLMNETTAVALSYGFYKQDLPAVEEKPRNVIFVDFGNANLQVSAVAFNKNKLKMLCSAWDQIGGRDFDVILAKRFAVDIKERYKVEAHKNPRAWLRLITEVEKIKKQMSANSTKLPLHIECFMDEIDVTSSMARTEMEELCEDLLKRTEATFEKCLADSSKLLYFLDNATFLHICIHNYELRVEIKTTNCSLRTSTFIISNFPPERCVTNPQSSRWTTSTRWRWWAAPRAFRPSRPCWRRCSAKRSVRRSTRTRPYRAAAPCSAPSCRRRYAPAISASPTFRTTR